MHIPDGFINGATSLGAGVVAAGGLGAALRQGGRYLGDRQIPLAGLVAAFVFALQMLNFPVAAGTSGHLLGGAFASILVGPWMGIVVVAVVVIVQALFFADGGVSALGLNVLNMALLTVAVAWPVFRALVRALPKRAPSVLVASLVAAWASVVVSSIGLALQYALGGVGDVPVGTVFGAMVGVHAVIGIGEGLITATAVGAVMAARPDLVYGVSDFEIVDTGVTAPGRLAVGSFVVAGLVVAIALVALVAPNANPNPDGLERVAEDTGFIETGADHPIGGPLADYGVSGIDSPAVGTALAGIIGTLVTFGVGYLLVAMFRRRHQPAEPADTGP
ncbi:MAG: energy-coupling factor ABC transporter permease [Acidimicrobiia bacterium]